MCGIAGAVSLRGAPVADLSRALGAMSELIAHRGPDGHGMWTSRDGRCGLAHRRLAIIDTSPSGHQPMAAPNGTVITYNGEVYNYRELAGELGQCWAFRSRSDTEVILAAYAAWGADCLSRLRGMFAFAIWDGDRLFAARDRFGIKPFYYTVVDDTLYFASEIKSLLPFLPEIATNPGALAEYLMLQYTIGDHTLFKHVRILLPGYSMAVENGRLTVHRYWDIRYDLDFDHKEQWFGRRLREALRDSISFHLRSDVPVGAYMSGGIDSSLVALLAAEAAGSGGVGFHGKFGPYPGYDESRYAETVARRGNIALHQADITAKDFRDSISKVIFHLDHPVGGPGSFPQYMVSKLAARHVKVVLGGQGGDEIFGGYVRYLIAYFEQCIAAAIDDTYSNGSYVVTAESIIPHLSVLQEYKPLLQQFFAEGLFGPIDERYFRLIDRSGDIQTEVDWSALDREGVFERFKAIFNSERNVRKEAYFDSMTHFDFKCLLPALLQVEDRMSMAHGLEARVPFLDVPVVELAATMPADVKFKHGQLKHVVKAAFADVLPDEVLRRRDKMGFPVPLKEWFSGELKDFIGDVFVTQKARNRDYLRPDVVLERFDKGERFSRKSWGLLGLELWHQLFHDRAAEYRNKLIRNNQEEMPPELGPAA